MSCSWGYRCWTCGVNSEDTWYNHGDDALRTVWEARATLRLLRDQTPILDDLGGHGRDAVSFVTEHHDHTVVLVDEYGHTSIQSRWIGCGKCVHEEDVGALANTRGCRLYHFPGEAVAAVEWRSNA